MKKILLLITYLISFHLKAQLCFTSPTKFPIDTFPQSIVTADFNNDGKLDLATANYQSSKNVAVLLGNGNGSFGAPSYFNAGNTPRTITTADFNNDNNVDLAVAN